MNWGKTRIQDSMVFWLKGTHAVCVLSFIAALANVSVLRLLNYGFNI